MDERKDTLNLEALPLPAVILDWDFRILSQNKQAETYLRCQEGDLLREIATYYTVEKTRKSLQHLPVGQSCDDILLDPRKTINSSGHLHVWQGAGKRLSANRFLLTLWKSSAAMEKLLTTHDNVLSEKSELENDYEEVKAMVAALRNLFQSFPLDTFQVDRFSRYTVIKDDEHLLLCPEQERTGLFWQDIVSGIADDVWALVRQSQKEEKVISEEFFVSTGDTEPYWIRVSSLYGKYYTFVSYTNISESKKRLEKLVQDERLSTVGVLAGGLAHQYNNLHHAVLGQLHMALKATGEEQKKILNSASSILESGSNLSQSLLLQLRQSDMQLHASQLSETLNRVQLLVRDELIRLKCNLVIDVDDTVVLTNPTSIDQVFVNLILNGAHACYASGREGTIKIYGRRKGDKMVVDVVDNGIGIAEKNFNKLFTPLFSTKGVYAKRSSPLSEIKGTGLGLSLAKQLLTDQGGNIILRRSSSRGTVFCVTLPIAAEEYLAKESRNLEPVEVKEVELPKNLNIYIADDSPENRTIVKVYLDGCFRKFTESENGKINKSQFLKLDPDVIFVDWLMPAYSGSDFLNYLESNKELKKYLDRTIILSGLESSEGILRWQPKIKKVLQKPVSQQQLLEALKD